MEILRTLKTFVLDTLFPISCIGCGKDNVWLCDMCLAAIEPLSFQVCPKCEKTISADGLVCQKCKPSLDLNGLLVCAKYKENSLNKLVHLYKYRFIEDLHVPLGKIMVRKIIQSHLPLPDIIAPIPLHPRRLRWRGFNQAELLANYIGENMTIGMKITVSKSLLSRKRFTSPQMKIKKYSERLNNLANAFTINSASFANKTIQGKTILLIDDIATTGATLFECARTLKEAGAKKVFAIVIARQET